MLAVRTSTGEGRYVASEWDSVWTSSRSGPALIWCHGNNGTALSDYAGYASTLRLFAQRYRVMIADLGFNTFGNDTGITRVGQAMTYLGVDEAVLVGASMGASVALNFARVYPEKVTAVACVIPAVSLVVPDNHPAADELDLAYPPAYDDSIHGAHNPVNFASELDSDLPIALWTSSNDPTCLPETADAFVAARPQTERIVFGAYGHGGIGVAAPLMDDWLRAVA